MQINNVISMAKRTIIKNKNIHIFDIGGLLDGPLSGMQSQAQQGLTGVTPIQQSDLSLPQASSGGMPSLGGGMQGAIGNLGKLAGGLISNGLESKAGSIISGVGDAVGSIPIFGGIAKAGLNIIGGGVNALFGSKMNTQKINEINAANTALKNTFVASDNAEDIMSQWSDQSLGDSFTKKDIGRDGVFSNKAGRKYRQLKQQQEQARNRAIASYGNAIENVDTQNTLNAQADFYALGGPLNTFADGGSIHIKPSKRGTFTAAATKHDMGVQEFASHVLANKEDYSPAMIKKANFARNASKWKHALGGSLTHGGNFTNGIITVGNGGTHENNPMEGVPMGTASDGKPNLVEEGEVVFNDYVFSNRLTIPNNIKDKYKLKKGSTFADAIKKLSKESEERPNDPISTRGLQAVVSDLASNQEEERMKKNKNNNQYAYGGKFGTLFAGPGGMDQFLDVNDSPATTPTTTVESVSTTDTNTPSTSGEGVKERDLSWLRYTPAIGAGISSILDIAGVTNKPDYSYANKVAAIANTPDYTYKPIGNYLTYTPLDRNYYLNKLNAQAGATRRAIINRGGNVGATMAGLLAAGYNEQNAMGEIMRQAAEQDIAARERVETFNRGTNAMNAQLGLQTYAANQKNRDLARLSLTQAANMANQQDLMQSQTRSANLTNLFDSLGDIGREEFERNMVNTRPDLLYHQDRSGRQEYKKTREKRLLTKQAEKAARKSKKSNKKTGE